MTARATSEKKNIARHKHIKRAAKKVKGIHKNKQKKLGGITNKQKKNW